MQIKHLDSLQEERTERRGESDVHDEHAAGLIGKQILGTDMTRGAEWRHWNWKIELCLLLD